MSTKREGSYSSRFMSHNLVLFTLCAHGYRIIQLNARVASHFTASIDESQRSQGQHLPDHAWLSDSPASTRVHSAGVNSSIDVPFDLGVHISLQGPIRRCCPAACGQVMHVQSFILTCIVARYDAMTPRYSYPVRPHRVPHPVRYRQI